VESAQYRLRLRHTGDGGRTWKAVNIPPVLTELYSDVYKPPVSKIKFVNASRGWLLGRNTHSTRDGGRSWQKDELPGTVESISAAGDTVWALSILPKEQDLEPTRVVLFESSVSRSTWKPLRTQPRSEPVGGAALFRLDALRAWFTWFGEPEAPSHGILITKDGGRSWGSTVIPCADREYGTIQANILLGAPGEPESVWAVCGGEAPLGPIPSLSVSRDGGASWERGAVQRRQRVPTHWTATSAKQMWCSGGKMVGLEYSDDLGVTWTTPAPFSHPDVHEGIGKVQFLDSRHGWVTYSGRAFNPDDSFSDWIFRTADGGRTWKGTKIAP
jgi:hypothetical protein